MCVILAKEKGVALPKFDIFKNCADNNNDGFGYAIEKNDKIFIKKGFFNVKKLYKELQNIKDIENKNLIVHFRIATSGQIDEKTCHPFPISENAKDLQTTNIYTDFAFAHNGIIQNIGDNKLSDTQVFIKEFLAKCKFLLNDNDKMEMLANMNNSRFALLTTNRLNLYGDWVFDKETNCFFSNTTYKPYKPYKYKYNYGYYDRFDSSDNWKKTEDMENNDNSTIQHCDCCWRTTDQTITFEGVSYCFDCWDELTG